MQKSRKFIKKKKKERKSAFPFWLKAQILWCNVFMTKSYFQHIESKKNNSLQFTNFVSLWEKPLKNSLTFWEFFFVVAQLIVPQFQSFYPFLQKTEHTYLWLVEGSSYWQNSEIVRQVDCICFTACHSHSIQPDSISYVMAYKTFCPVYT